MNNKFFSGFKRIIDHNAPTITTFGSVVACIAALYFMHRASKNAAEVEEKYEAKLECLKDKVEVGEMSEDEFKEEKAHLRFNKILHLVTVYRFGLLCGTGSMIFAILSNYLSGMQLAGLGTILALEQDRIQKGGEKLKELIGEEKFKEFQESLEKDILGEQLSSDKHKVEKSKVSKNDDTPLDDYEEFCVPQTGEVYKAPRWLVEEAIEHCTQIFKSDKCAYLDYNTWRARIRIPSAPFWTPFAWTTKNPFKAHIGKVDFDGRCMDAIIFDVPPTVERSLTR